MVPDADLKRAQLVKVSMETLAIAMTVVLYAQMILSDDVKYRWKKKFEAWRTLFFGRPPLTEEQIKEAVRQVMVEALRTVRSGDEPGC